MSSGYTGVARLTNVNPDRTLLGNLLLSRGVVDRAAQFRADDAWLAERRCDDSSLVIRVALGGAVVSQGGDSLELLPAVHVDPETHLTLLGVDDEGVAFFSHHLDSREGDPEAWADLRQAGARLGARDAGLMVAAVALDNWIRTHQFCPACGGPTEPISAGWARRCLADGSDHFPRTDPAVICLVRDREDRALLGRQGAWAEGWFSTLAGFVEAGESAEAALRREVFEESGVVLANGPDDIHYLGSQPWPFPRSLMLGYHAWTDEPSIDVDGEEIAEAHWFTREELAEQCAAGTVRLPPPISIARRLIERWFGAELPGDWSRPLTVPR